MIAWWWVLVAFVAGEIIGLMLMAVCTANEPDNHSERG